MHIRAIMDLIAIPFVGYMLSLLKWQKIAVILIAQSATWLLLEKLVPYLSRCYLYKYGKL